jgi:hypothetical protein
VGVGVGMGLMVYHFNLPWFFSRHSAIGIEQTLAQTEAIIIARKKRENKGRHLVGRPLTKSAVKEVFEEAKPPNESRKL